MSSEMPQPAEGAHLRTVTLLRDANASGDIFGGWTLSQMDLAGGTFAAATPAAAWSPCGSMRSSSSSPSR